MFSCLFFTSILLETLPWWHFNWIWRKLKFYWCNEDSIRFHFYYSNNDLCYHLWLNLFFFILFANCKSEMIAIWFYCGYYFLLEWIEKSNNIFFEIDYYVIWVLFIGFNAFRSIWKCSEVTGFCVCTVDWICPLKW